MRGNLIGDRIVVSNKDLRARKGGNIYLCQVFQMTRCYYGPFCLMAIIASAVGNSYHTKYYLGL